MTWEELKEKAKEMGADLYLSNERECIFHKNIFYFSDGSILWGHKQYEHRTPEQMLMIMRGLE